MRNKYLISILTLSALMISTLMWDSIKLPFDYQNSMYGEYEKQNYNPNNDTLRFIFFVLIPLMTFFVCYLKFNKENLCYLLNNDDQDGSDASVFVVTSLSLYPVKSIDHSLAEKPSPFESVLVQIVLDNTNKTNGPLRVVPGTHKKLGWPDDHIKNVNLTHKKEKLVFLKKGSIVVINGNLWHGGTGNISGNKRRIILIDIRNRNLPQLLNQKKYIDKKVLNNLNEYQKYLLGVRDIDKNQKEKSFGSGQAYRMKYGRKRD